MTVSAVCDAEPVLLRTSPAGCDGNAAYAVTTVFFVHLLEFP